MTSAALDRGLRLWGQQPASRRPTRGAAATPCASHGWSPFSASGLPVRSRARAVSGCRVRVIHERAGDLLHREAAKHGARPALARSAAHPASAPPRSRADRAVRSKRAHPGAARASTARAATVELTRPESRPPSRCEPPSSPAPFGRSVNRTASEALRRGGKDIYGSCSPAVTCSVTRRRRARRVMSRPAGRPQRGRFARVESNLQRASPEPLFRRILNAMRPATCLGLRLGIATFGLHREGIRSGSVVNTSRRAVAEKALATPTPAPRPAA